MSWIWYKPDGIRYLRALLTKPQPYYSGYWLRSMNILSRFSSWREISIETLNRIWEQRDREGMWNFGYKIAQSIDFPLSVSWRHPINRKMDYSTCILALLRKCFD